MVLMAMQTVLAFAVLMFHASLAYDPFIDLVKDCDTDGNRPEKMYVHCMFYCGQNAQGKWRYGIYKDGLPCPYGQGNTNHSGVCHGGLCYLRGTQPTANPGTKETLKGEGEGEDENSGSFEDYIYLDEYSSLEEGDSKHNGEEGNEGKGEEHRGQENEEEGDEEDYYESEGKVEEGDEEDYKEGESEEDEEADYEEGEDEEEEGDEYGNDEYSEEDDEEGSYDDGYEEEE